MTEVVSQVEQFKQMTHNIPALARQDPRAFQKAWRVMSKEKAARGPKSAFFDPLSLQYALGYKDRRYSLTYDTLKRISNQLSVVAAIINTRIAQIAAFSQPYRITKSLGYVIRHKDPEHATTASEKRFVKQLEDFVASCGEPGRENPHTRIRRPNFEQFLKMIVRDTLTYDQTAFEIIPRNNGLPFEFRAVDGATLRLASPDKDTGELKSLHQRNPIHENAQVHLNRLSGMYVGQRYGSMSSSPGQVQYVQIVNGQIENVYTDQELAFGVRNPRTDIYIQGYGFGEMEQLITILTSMLYAEEYNRRFFCVSGNLVITTNQGLQRIEDCYKMHLSNQGEMQMAVGTETQTIQSHGEIWTGSKWSPYRVYKTGMKPLARTQLETGYTIETSPGHWFKVIPEKSSTGLPEWLEQRDLKPGDRVLVSSALLEYNTADTSFEKDGGSFGRSFKIEDAKEDLWETLGWWLGDGSVGRGTNDFLVWYYRRNSEESIADQHKCVLEGYGLEVGEGTVALTGFAEGSSGRSGPRLKVSQNTFVAYLEYLGLIKEGTSEKQIPKTLFSESVENRCAFIRGYFGADGCTNKAGTLIFSMKAAHKKSWIKPFQQLLLTLGIRSRWQKSPGHLVVTDTDKFNQLVGFIHDHKRDRSPVDQRLKGAGERLHSALCQRIAKHVMNSVFYDRLSSSQKKMVQANAVGRERMSAQKFREILEIVGVHTYDEILSYYQVKIKSVKQTDSQIPMYDIEVLDDDHQFVGDGVVVHNTQGAHPKGMLNFKGDNWTPDQLEAFKRQWVAQVAGAENAWKTPITQSEGVEWINMQLTNQDMQFNVWIEYLIKVGCAVFLIDPAEINFDLHGGVQQTPLFESSQEWKLKASRDRGLKPLLRFIANLINVHVIDRIDDHFVFEFAGLDELTEQEKHEMLKEQIATYMTLNEGRRSLDMPDLGEIGELPMNPTLIQALQFLNQKQQDERQQEMEEAQMQQEQGAPPEEEAVPPDMDMKREAHQQKMQQQEERHPLEMELLKQKISQANAAPGESPGEAPQDSRREYSDLVGKSVDFDQYIEDMRGRNGDDNG
jgi:intein/homing endonuclease